jgi:acetate kinase
MRARISEKMNWLGAQLDATANAAGKTLISENGSRVALYVIATDEELMIARHTLAVLWARYPIQPEEDKISA